MPYEFRGMVIPDDMLEAIERYVEHGIEPGHFLTAIICNDLKEACARADGRNIGIIPAYAAWFYNHAPIPCWGSAEKMDAWIERHAAAREARS